MDGIFERKNFKNEIVWGYKTGGVSKKRFAIKHDVIFVYAKNEKACYFKPQKYKSWQEKKYNYNEKYPELWDDDKKKWYHLSYCRDVWEDIKPLGTENKERLGYPTQKPLALLNRIIKASCPSDGIILDPFCGCGTALISAIQNERSWIGIDISYDAVDVIERRIKDVTFDYNVDYEQRDGSPQTLTEYERLSPFQKQDWLIQKTGGFPNPKKSGDGGVDGDVAVHLGLDKNGQDKWGKVVYSVKTGEQCNPAMIRELKGTMQDYDATIGILILDRDPSDNMDIAASKAGQIEYSYNKDLPPSYFDKVQIITSGEIMSGRKISMPPTMQKIMEYRKQTEQMSF